VVSNDDVVYHLGDLTLGNSSSASEVLSQLNGHIRVLGNPWHHDARWINVAQSSRDGEVEIEKPIVVLEHMIKPDGWWLPVVLCHYPFEVWDRSHYGAVHFHGHTHGALHRTHNRLDVGVDMAFKLLGEYRPFRMDEAIALAMNNDENTPDSEAE
jgi:calcineurin-like phosphoesterase family protein